jgi:hypothetical protein
MGSTPRFSYYAIYEKQTQSQPKIAEALPKMTKSVFTFMCAYKSISQALPYP